MKKILRTDEKKVAEKSVKKLKYEMPEIHGTTGKASMSGAGCPTHTTTWQQVSCKC